VDHLHDYITQSTCCPRCRCLIRALTPTNGVVLVEALAAAVVAEIRAEVAPTVDFRLGSNRALPVINGSDSPQSFVCHSKEVRCPV
jgi:hypothetical protein